MQRKGEITKPSKYYLCSKETKRLVKHHENYALPTDIIWLGESCHGRRHIYLADNNWVDYVEESEGFGSENKQLVGIDVMGIFLTMLAESRFNTIEKLILRLKLEGKTLEEIGEEAILTISGVVCALKRVNIKCRQLLQAG